MNRRDFLTRTATAGAALSLGACALAQNESRRKKPNIILILADDLGYGDLSCYGSKVISTPNFDRMATEGARFTHFYSAANICTPSRAALLTGSYPQRCGLYMGINPKRPQHKHLGLHPQETTIAEMLKTNGYATLCVGKWHLGTDPVFHPMNHGFDEYFGMPHNFLHSPEIWDGYKVVQKRAKLTELTRQYTDRVLDFIERKKDQPFFIYLPHTYPHGPCAPSPEYKGTSQAGNFGDVVQEIDGSTGEILAKLKELGIDKDTLVLFTSDNGPVPPNTKKYNSTGPLAGSKYNTYEGGHREPFIAYWPGRIPAGQTCAELTSTMDFLPTIAGLTGAALPENPIDGKDIWLLLAGEAGAKSPHEVLFYYNSNNLQAVLWEHWKLHLPRTPEMIPWWQRNHGGIESLDKPFLVDLDNDIAETTNVADQHPEVVEKMLAFAKEAREKFGTYNSKGSLQRETGDSRRLPDAGKEITE